MAIPRRIHKGVDRKGTTSPIKPMRGNSKAK